MKSISFIIPVYNTEQKLKRCLDSIINNNYFDYEIIAINDGSTDKSEKILKEYEKNNTNVIVESKSNTGQGDTRNIALMKATKEYIWFVDSDDYIENSLNELMKNFDILDLDVLVFDSTEIVGKNKRILKGYYEYTNNIQKNYILSPPGPCNKIYKREFLMKNNFQFLVGHVQEDLATIPVLGIFTNKIKYIEKSFYNYEITPGSTMHQQNYNKKLEDIFFAMKHLSNLFKQFDVEKKYQKELEYIYIENMLHGATLRFLNFKEGIQQIDKTVAIINEKIPKWNRNIYYKRQSIKYKIMCQLTMKKKYKLLVKLLKRSVT